VTAERSTIVACTLGMHDLKSQSERWRALLEPAGRERVETEDGLRLVFANEPGVEVELRALVGIENACCGWAIWDVAAQDGTIVMSARSTGVGIATLHGMFLS
jgi:hypothetical protein